MGSRVSALVVKRPDMFGFRNPGLMRIPVELAVQGGNSDCRNRRLQTMFRLVGYGDHAGSGIPKIFRNWESEHWRRPLRTLAEVLDRSPVFLRQSYLNPMVCWSCATQLRLITRTRHTGPLETLHFTEMEACHA